MNDNDIYDSKTFAYGTAILSRAEQEDDADNVTDDMERYTPASVILREVNPDGTTQYQRLPYPIRGMVLQNFSTVNLTVSFSDGTSITVVSGLIIKIIPPSTQQFKAYTSAAGSGYIAILCYPYYIEPDAINLSSSGGTASAVEVLDGAGTNKLAIDASGDIGINNFPATQPVSGSVSVSNFPATQPVSGSVNVGNFPATQPVSAIAGAIADLTHGQAAMANSVPVVIANNQSSVPTSPAINSGGGQANLWSAAVTGVGGNSTAVGFASQHFAAVFGHVSAATTISLQYSADDINFYTVATSTTSGASDFAFTNLIVPAGIVIRLQSSASVTATATLLGSN